MMTLAGVYARLGMGDEALETLETAVGAYVNSNATMSQTAYQGMGIGSQNFWATYNLTANCGFSAVMQEMLIQSGEDTLSVLPAKPSDWKKGGVEGLGTRFGAAVDVEWDNKKVTFRIKMKKAKTIRVFVPSSVTRVKGVKKFDAATHSFVVDLAANKAVSFSFAL